MRIKTHKNGSIKMSADTSEDSELLYMFISCGKHSLPWFNRCIGKEILQDGTPIMVTDYEHATQLFNSQEDGHKFGLYLVKDEK